MLIASKSIVNKSKSGTKLLIKYPMLISAMFFSQLINELKPKKRLRKKLCIKNNVENDDLIKVKTLDKNLIIRRL